MKPIAILSTDNTPDYLFCAPIVIKSWELQGFDVLLIRTDKHGHDVIDKYCRYSTWDELPYFDCEMNPKLFTQCIRLYGQLDLEPHQYCITGDIDMFIASNFLCRDADKVNVFGHDLTGFEHIPICYVGMKVDRWREVMQFGKKDYGIHYDLMKYCDLTNKQRAWTADQDIITGRLKEYGYDKINFISRGTDPSNHNLPIGRWDRYGGFKKPIGQIHDVHLPREPMSAEVFPKIVAMCQDIYPGENWEWLYEYRQDFLKNINAQFVAL